MTAKTDLRAADIDSRWADIKAKNKNRLKRERVLREAIRDWVEQRRRIDTGGLEALWMALREAAGKDEQGREDLSSRDAARLIFDLQTGPMLRASPEQASPRELRQHADATSRSEALGSNVFDTNAFLRPPKLNRPEKEAGEIGSSGFTPARFARAIAETERNDGVFFVAGMRGSGKTSLLNLVRLYARNPVKPRRPPLLIEFDLGVNFNEEQFARDLILEICRAGRQQLPRFPKPAPPKPASGDEQSSFTKILRFNYYVQLAAARVVDASSALVRTVGRIGRLCAANSAWSLVVLLLLTVLFHFAADGVTQADGQPHAVVGMDRLLAYVVGNQAVALPEIPAPNGEQAAAVNDILKVLNNFAINEQAANQDPLLPLPILGDMRFSHFAFLWWLLATVLLLGAAYLLAREAGDADWGPVRWRRRRDRGGALLGARTMTLVVATVACATIIVAAGSYRGYVQALGLPLPFTSPYIVALTMALLAIVSLPAWWRYDVGLARIQTEVRSKAQDANPFAELVGFFGSLLARMLPRAESRDTASELSLPFTQEQTKRVCAICAQAFPRVVVLIDDVDALPSGKLHEFLRLIRPLTKVRGVCCVASVPPYFYPVMYGTRELSDIHSTVREIIMLGDSKLFSVAPNGGDFVSTRHVNNQQGLLAARDRFLCALLVGKMRLRLATAEDIDGYEERLAKYGPFKFALRAWHYGDPKVSEAAKVEQWQALLQKYGQSRREFIRLIEESIESGELTQADSVHQIERLKTVHDISETILDVASKERLDRYVAMDALAERGGLDPDRDSK